MTTSNSQTYLKTRQIQPTEKDIAFFDLLNVSSENRGVFAIICKRGNINKTYYVKNLLDAKRFFKNWDSVYFSPNLFKTWHDHSKENLSGVLNTYIDIDTIHEHTKLTKEDKLNFWALINQVVKLPQETALIDSGNGFHVYFMLDDIVNDNSQDQVFVRMIERINRYFGKQVQKAITSLNLPIKVDFSATNANRLLRLPATTNDEREVHVLSLHKNKRYDLDSLFDYLPTYDESKITKKNKNKKANLSVKRYYPNNLSRVNENRIVDLIQLLKLREYDIEGLRNVYFHILACQFNCHTISEDIWINELYKLNNQLSAPLSNKELDTIIKSATRHNYLYKNATICDRLAITDDEIAQFNILRRSTREEERELKRKEKMNQDKVMVDLLNDGISKVAVAEILGINRSTVYRRLEKLDKIEQTTITEIESLPTKNKDIEPNLERNNNHLDSFMKENLNKSILSKRSKVQIEQFFFVLKRQRDP